MCRHGVSLHAKFELGYDESTGQRIPSTTSHNTVIRSISYRKGYTPPKNNKKIENLHNIEKIGGASGSYTSKSVLVGNFEYPFPSGIYLSRVIQLIRSASVTLSQNSLLEMITEPCLGNKYSKEISEIMVSKQI